MTSDESDNYNDTCDSMDSTDESQLLTSSTGIRSDGSLPRLVIDRQSSVILANTGERVHRSISFSNSQDTLTDTDSLFLSDGVLYQRVVVPVLRVYHNEVFRNVFKCSMAYFLASLGVYYTPFDEFLGSTDSKHVVATVAVYSILRGQKVP